jgi:hypothetical protein
MFDFTLSLQPVIQFMTLLPSPCFEELVSTFADEVGDTFDGTATRVRAIVHLLQYPTSDNLSDYSHIQIASFVLNNTDGCTRVSNHVSSEYLPASPAQPDGSTARDFSNSFINIIRFPPSEGEPLATQAEESGETIAFRPPMPAGASRRTP